jgi:endonuclease/exonuclease/phosphatase family metal-dependent hydrolase
MKKIFVLLFVASVLYGQENSFFQEEWKGSSSEFTVLSLNSALLALTAYIPWVGTVKLKEVGKLQNNQKRANLIRDVIKRLHQQGNSPDIIVLQEAFDIPVIENFIAKLKNIYPHSRFDSRSGRFTLVGGIQVPIGTNSGLVILSKFPLKKTMLKDFECFLGEGAFARKGLLGAQLEVNGRTVYVFTTHLQAGVGSEPFKWFEDQKLLPATCTLDDKPIDKTNQRLTTQEVRRAELQQAKKWIDEFATDKKAAVIFAGDLNIDIRNAKAVQDIKNVFAGVEDLYNQQKSAPFTGTVWNGNQVEQGKRIDYMLVVRNPEKLVKGDAWIVTWFGPQHSDHLGYFGRFSFNR